MNLLWVGPLNLGLCLSLFAGGTAYATCSSPDAPIGARNYSTSDNEYQLCTSTGWVNFETSETLNACTSGEAAQMDYDATENYYYYCNGTNWLAIGESGGGPSCDVDSMSYEGRTVNSTQLSSASPIQIHPDGDKVVIGGQFSDRIAVYDVSDPTNPSFMDSAQNSFLSDSVDMVIANGHAFSVARGNNNLVVVDISDPNDVTYVTRAQAAVTSQLNNAWSIAASKNGDYVYTMSFNSGSGGHCWLNTFDVSDPNSPTEVSAINVSTVASVSAFCDRIRSHGDYLYIAFPSGGDLVAFDILDPADPVYLSKDSNTNANQQMALTISEDGQYAYTATSSNNYLHVWDISDPMNVSHVTALQDSTHVGSSYGINAIGKYVFVQSSNNNRLTAFDVSDPSNPTVAATVQNSNYGGPENSVFIGNYAYTTGYSSNSFAYTDLGCDLTGGLGGEPASFGSCSTPRVVQYDSGNETLMWCDGADWRKKAGLGTGSSGGGDPVEVVLTTGSSWDVPSDWNNSNNTVECIGGGAGGGNSGSGGGGGAYARVTNLTLTPGGSASYQIGSGGGPDQHGGDTWFVNSSTLLAKGGRRTFTASGGAGGSAGESIGDLVYAGGSGGNRGEGSGTVISGGGGGGAAGPNGAGGNGGNGTGQFSNAAGGGGGGHGGGSPGANAPNATSGGAGGNNYLGSGGGSPSGGNGSDGGGGAGRGNSGTGGTGSMGFDLTDTVGSGGGGGGARSGVNSGGAAGNYGGGGGGAGATSAGSDGGPGAQGVCVIKYTP